MFPTLALLVLLQFLSAIQVVRTQTTSLNCPILGADFPAPQNLSSSALVSNAKVSFTKLLGNTSSLLSTDTAFSIGFFSLDEDELVFQYHYSPTNFSRSPNSVRTIDADSIYRIGSWTKVFTVWTFLIEAGDIYFNQPITKYVPELAAVVGQASNNTLGFDDIDNVRWDDVTLGALASQMAGIARSRRSNFSL